MLLAGNYQQVLLFIFYTRKKDTLHLRKIINL